MLPKSLIVNQPNLLQHVHLDWVEPSAQNFRLHIERTSLTKLRNLYQRYNKKPVSTVLPDFPVLRFHGYNKRLEILAGERRLTAAHLEQVELHPARIVTMSDEEAVRFIIEHNDVTRLSTAEVAYSAAELDRLGFTHDEIHDILGDIGVRRYIAVGRLISPDSFTDDPKAEVSITTWYAAAEEGLDHFRNCFLNWNLGRWDEKECKRNFTKADRKPRSDTDAQGFRITTQGDRLILRGTVDLRFLDSQQARNLVNRTTTELHKELALGLSRAGWSPYKKVTTVLPED